MLRWMSAEEVVLYTILLSSKLQPQMFIQALIFESHLPPLLNFAFFCSFILVYFFLHMVSRSSVRIEGIISFLWALPTNITKCKQNEMKQNKIIQNKMKQKTKWNKIKQNKTKWNKIKQNEMKQNKMKQNETKQNETK